MAENYSIDVVYAYAQLGLTAIVSLDDVEEVLANTVSYRFSTKERLAILSRILDFFVARNMFGAIDASYEDIRKYYHKKAMVLHPDRNQGNAAAEEQLKVFNLAFELIESIYREARDYFKQDEDVRRNFEQEARRRREKEAPEKHRKKRGREDAVYKDRTAAETTNSRNAQQKASHEKSTKPSTPGSLKYMAGSVPRFIRTVRLSYLRLNNIIGSWSVKMDNGAYYIYDVIMLQEKEFLRARAYLSTPELVVSTLVVGKFAPPYAFRDIKEILVSPREDPENYARAYFIEEFHLSS